MDDEAFSYYLQQLRGGKEYQAAYDVFLTESDPDDIPKLIAAFYADTSIGMQMVLLEIIWQQYSPDTLNFLATVLQHPNSELWQTALDGVFFIGTPMAMTILKTEQARLRSIHSLEAHSRLEYIDEAIQQLSEWADN